MKKFITLRILTVILGSCQILGLQPTAIFAQPATQQHAEPALKFVHEWSDEIPQERRAEILAILNTALVVVQAFAPKEDNLFAWKGDRRAPTFSGPPRLKGWGKI